MATERAFPLKGFVARRHRTHPRPILRMDDSMGTEVAPTVEGHVTTWSPALPPSVVAMNSRMALEAIPTSKDFVTAWHLARKCPHTVRKLHVNGGMLAQGPDRLECLATA